MVERIERVVRVKGIESEANRFFERKEGYEDHRRGKKQFARVLDREINKEERPANEAGAGIPNAYKLDLSLRPTQSLFYVQGVDLREAERKMHDAG